MARFILTKQVLLDQYNDLSERCDKVSFSMKTNLDVAKVLEQETDCDFSVHTSELQNDIEDKTRVLFFMQAQSKKQVLEILRQGIEQFVVDNESDMETLENSLKGTEFKITLFLRIKLKENTIRTGRHFVFGMPSDKANVLVERLSRNPNIKSLGIHFHRKTQNISEWSLQNELEQILTQKTLANIEWLNMGGGLPINYVNSKVQNYDYIWNKVQDVRDWLKKYDVKLVIEPGRYLSAPCVKLEAEIIQMYEGNIIIDASVFNAAMDTFIAHVRLEVEGEVSQKEGKAYVIKGCTPDSMDILRYRVYLKEPQVGDKLVFHNAGAYNFCTDFCGLKKIPTEIIDRFL